MKAFLPIALQAILLVLAIVFTLSIVPEAFQAKGWHVPYLWMLAGFGLTYLGLVPFVPKIYAAATDSFYLVFLGISGMRFLLYMATLVMLLLIHPEVQNVPIIMAVTIWFVLAMFIEMSVFLTNLRRNSKKQSQG